MFIVLGCMMTGIFVGFLLRNKKIRFFQALITTLIWLLLFLLGLEIGANKDVVSQFRILGWEAFLIASAGTSGSILMAKLLWKHVEKKDHKRKRN